MNECFECGSDKNLIEHHVVPRSRGGKKTITLCQIHHDIVHGHDNPRDISVSQLTIEGLNKARARGVRFGNPRPKRAIKLAHAEIQARKNEFNTKLYNTVKHLFPISYNRIAKYLNDINYPSRRNGRWTHRQVQRALEDKLK